jgi:hypothetical protein
MKTSCELSAGPCAAPAGLFAIADATSSNPDGFVGSWVLALTAHSNVLQTFDGVDGTVALHSREAPLPIKGERVVADRGSARCGSRLIVGPSRCRPGEPTRWQCRPA